MTGTISVDERCGPSAAQAVDAARRAVAATQDGMSVTTALREAGLLDLSAPWRAATSPETLLHVCEHIGHEDGPMGRLFVAAQAAAVLHWAIPSLRDGVDEGAHVAGADTVSGVLEPGEDGLLLTGRWHEVPGADCADWVALPCRCGPRELVALLPAASVRREASVDSGRFDDTAAPDVVCDEVTVAYEQVVDVTGPQLSRHSRSLPMPLHTRQAATGVLLGITRRAVREFVATARHRSRAGSVERMIEQPMLQRELNRSVQGFLAARELLIAETARTAAVPAANMTPSRGIRVRLAAAQFHAQQAALATVRFVFTKAGGSSLYSGHPLERAWREVESLSSHSVFGAAAEGEVARTQFGGYPRFPVL
ncbi:acyl-CoA dehydrogenase family protein [Saccharomonospora sp.]|uniref:acyl-CoA dehydrogenase family protein n=1 Tax=Saccharomonospora sp. TaxID=33913 RepID=UPI002634BE74|nr:acyl-CoA dehydrogenase family protein [Saccharomonospora sp.]